MIMDHDYMTREERMAFAIEMEKSSRMWRGVFYALVILLCMTGIIFSTIV